MHHELHRSDTKNATMTTKWHKKEGSLVKKKCVLTIIVTHGAEFVSGKGAWFRSELANCKKYFKLRSEAPSVTDLQRSPQLPLSLHPPCLRNYRMLQTQKCRSHLMSLRFVVCH